MTKSKEYDKNIDSCQQIFNLKENLFRSMSGKLPISDSHKTGWTGRASRIVDLANKYSHYYVFGKRKNTDKSWRQEIDIPTKTTLKINES